MTALKAMPLALLISGVNGWVFTACQFLLKRLEVNELQSIGLRDPDRIALCLFIEQAERSCRCEIVIHRHLLFRTIVPTLRSGCR
jgi:hypothetical protein